MDIELQSLSAWCADRFDDRGRFKPINRKSIRDSLAAERRAQRLASIRELAARVASETGDSAVLVGRPPRASLAERSASSREARAEAAGVSVWTLERLEFVRRHNAALLQRVISGAASVDAVYQEVRRARRKEATHG